MVQISFGFIFSMLAILICTIIIVIVNIVSVKVSKKGVNIE